MEFRNPKIQFYKVRTFSERLNVTFDFLRENWKPMLKGSLYLILPLCLFQSFLMDSFMRVYMGLLTNELALSSGNIATSNLVSVIGYYALLIVCAQIGYLLLSAMVYSLIQTYERRENHLVGITFADYKALFIQNMIKIVRIILFAFGAMMFVTAVIALLAWGSLWTLALTVPVLLIGLVIVLVPLSIFTPLYLFEDLPFPAALSKAVKYGFSAWGEIFLTVLVFGLLAGIISGVASLPWNLVTFVGSLFQVTQPDMGLQSSIWYQLLTYLLGIILAYGAYLASIISVVGIAFLYFHLREKREGVTMKADIANFDRL